MLSKQGMKKKENMVQNKDDLFFARKHRKEPSCQNELKFQFVTISLILFTPSHSESSPMSIRSDINFNEYEFGMK